MKRVSFKTVGCRLNQAETACMTAQFISAGYTAVPFGTPCDICVIHSCAITANAERKSLQYARSAKNSQNNTFVILTGCSTELHGNELMKSSGADLLIHREDKFRLPELVSNISRHKNIGTHASQVIPHFETTRASIRIQDGCNFNCAYCVVPHTRGKPVSRSIAEIMNEIKTLADRGYKEVVLTGANLGCFANDKEHLVHLLEKIEAVKNISRIRLSSIEFSADNRAVIKYMAQSDKLCRYLHLPMQSGDDNILTAMGRRYTIAQFRALVDYAVTTIPLLGLGTDIITGFPGETESAFENTFEAVLDMPFSNLHVFPYSKRPFTAAASMPDQIKYHDKKSRSNRLINLGKMKRKTFAEKFIGTTVSVLIEHINQYGTAKGWTGEYLEAIMTANDPKQGAIIEFTPKTTDNDGKLS